MGRGILYPSAPYRLYKAFILKSSQAVLFQEIIDKGRKITFPFIILHLLHPPIPIQENILLNVLYQCADNSQL